LVNCFLIDTRVKTDLKLTINILTKLTEEKETSENISQKLLVPTKRNDKKLVLKPIENCMYFEGRIDDDTSENGRALDDKEERVFIAHEDITSHLAKTLGLSSLKSRLVDASEFGFEECGQHEPITQRIKNILDEYPDDSAIFRELIQNADDAGANVIHFVLDLRKNDNFKPNRLLDPEMAAWQGTALWAYNDAKFEESDFENIQKLGGQTKADIAEKIGKFGVGFNSVYHMTDVPSFVSDKFIVFFDPYASNLKTHIKNKARPGIKIDFTTNKNLWKFKDQFDPYEGLFGCHLTTNPAPFEGTLFRLPFRQKVPNQEIKISEKIYAQTMVETLKESFQNSVGKLLLFTQSVSTVSFKIIPENSKSAPNMSDEVLVKKKLFKRFRDFSLKNDLPTTKIFHQASVLKTATKVLESSTEFDKLCPTPSQSAVIEMSKTAKGQKQKSSFFLVTSTVGIQSSFDMASTEHGKKTGLLPCGGVASELEIKKNGKNVYFIPKETKGEVFCFLPLLVPSGLPGVIVIKVFLLSQITFCKLQTVSFFRINVRNIVLNFVPSHWICLTIIACHGC
jgi:sacsin